MWTLWNAIGPLGAVRMWVASLAALFTIFTLVIQIRIDQLQTQADTRSLSGDQQDAIVKQLTEFGGTPFSLYVNPDPESVALMNQIDAALGRSRWARTPVVNSGLVIADKAAAYRWSGILILVPAKHETDFKARSLALRAALGGAGLATQMGIQPHFVDPGGTAKPLVMNPDVIHIAIGAK